MNVKDTLEQRPDIIASVSSHSHIMDISIYIDLLQKKREAAIDLAIHYSHSDSPSDHYKECAFMVDAHELLLKIKTQRQVLIYLIDSLVEDAVYLEQQSEYYDMFFPELLKSSLQLPKIADSDMNALSGLHRAWHKGNHSTPELKSSALKALNVILKKYNK